MTNHTAGQFLIAGIGGQGVVTAASLLSKTATGHGLRVLGSETHGMSQRGGSVVSHWKVGEFTAPLIAKGAADCLIAMSDIEGYRNLDFLKAGGNALFNASHAQLRPEVAAYFDEHGMQVRVIDALAEVATKKAYKSLNLLMLGYLAACGWLPFSTEALEETVAGFGKPQFRDANLWAFRHGAEMARQENAPGG